jgi:hypothetical protein
MSEEEKTASKKKGTRVGIVFLPAFSLPISLNLMIEPGKKSRSANRSSFGALLHERISVERIKCFAQDLLKFAAGRRKYPPEAR